MSIAVGIDLGTTNTVVGAVRDGLAFTIADTAGRRLIPSIVSFHPSGNVLVGAPALDRRLNDAPNTIFSVKRLIGRSWQSEEVQKACARFAFKIKEGPKSGILVTARGEEYTLPEISAFVLRYAKATAEAALGEPVDRAVITVPANFNDLQRAATKVAGKLAGLEVLRILNEPTAAALAYGQGAGQSGGTLSNDGARAGANGERVVVYDLGGGTFDVTLLDLSGNVFEVLSTAGDTSLGGDDFDQILADKMADELLKKHRFDARANPQAYGMLRIAAESLKRELSGKEEVTVQLNDVAFGESGKAIPFSFRITRPELEWSTLALVDRTFKVCEAALERANLKLDQINRVILVGGSTRMPLVARRVEQFFKQPPVMRVNPDEVVALGAAIQAVALDRAGGGRRRAATQPVAQPVISGDSTAAPMAHPPPKPRRDEPPMPDLPIITGYAKPALEAPPAPPSRPASGRIARENAPPRVDARAEEASGPSRIAAQPIVPIATGDLDLDLPTPEADNAHSNLGRPLVFDLPPAPQRTQVMPVVQQQQPALPPPPERRPDAPPPRPPPPAPTQHPRAAPVFDIPPVGASPAMAFAAAPFEPSVTRDAPKPPLLIDVTPLSLSVETVGGFCDRLIDANTPVPCDRTRVFLTASDNQTAVFVRVAQGESQRFAENTFLGELELSGLKAARRGDAQIAVTFEIDADGILNVKARDQGTGNETKARMHLMGAQTEEHELEAMHARQARHAVS